ncbi:MAG: hypothetical protein DMF68_08915 [Acidobacteria bacterium]|nr:MAG: hypothetical protein DMF68_08915 [Acidobacteriota bacterium]
MATLQQDGLRTSDEAGSCLEVDSFAGPFEIEREQSTLVIASYNIRYAVGSRLIGGSLGRRLGISLPKRRPRLVERNIERGARILSDNLRLPAPQILALQEADKETVRAGSHHIARELARRLRMNYAFAPLNVEQGESPKSREWYLNFEEQISPAETGRTGVALLSRLPFAEIKRLDLPWHKCAWRPRLAIAATFQIGERRLHLFNSHIDPHSTIPEQIEQHEAVLAHADEIDDPVILLGDFNTLSKRSCLRIREFLESRGYTTPFRTGTATWRSGPIRLHTDWIFTRGAKVLSYGVVRRLSVSDHWPVWAEIDLKD